MERGEASAQGLAQQAQERYRPGLPWGAGASHSGLFLTPVPYLFHYRGNFGNAVFTPLQLLLGRKCALMLYNEVSAGTVFKRL